MKIFKLTCALISSISISAWAAECPSLEGFYVQDIRQKQHFEIYDINDASKKITGFAFRSFDNNDNPEKVVIPADGKIYQIDKVTTSTARCEDGELVRRLHTKIPASPEFPASESIDIRRFKRLESGDLQVFTQSNYKSENFFDESFRRSIHQLMPNSEFPEDRRDYEIIPVSTLQVKGQGHPNPDLPSIIDQFFINGLRFSAKIDRRQISLFTVNPSDLEVTGAYFPSSSFSFGSANGRAPSPLEDFTMEVLIGGSVNQAQVKLWNEKNITCSRSRPTGHCQRELQSLKMGEFSFRVDGMPYTLTSVVGSESTSSIDPNCCRDL